MVESRCKEPYKNKIFFQNVHARSVLQIYRYTHIVFKVYRYTRFSNYMIIINGGRCQRFFDSIFWPVIFVDSDFGLFCRDIGLFFAHTGLFRKEGHTRHVQKVSICQICRLTFGTIDHLTSESRHR